MDGSGKGLQVLIAEDNIVNQIVARRLLEKQGFRVEVVCNGKEALQALQRRRYDLVLMDVQMPEMDGVEATRTFRQMEQAGGAHVPIVALTADHGPENRQRCLDAGMDGYILKPIDMKALRYLIEQLLPPRPV